MKSYKLGILSVLLGAAVVYACNDDESGVLLSDLIAIAVQPDSAQLAIGDTLRILFDEPQEFFREKVKSREVSGYLAGIARAVAGKDLKLAVEAAPASTAPAAASTASAAPPPGPGAGGSYSKPPPRTMRTCSSGSHSADGAHHPLAATANVVVFGRRGFYNDMRGK